MHNNKCKSNLHPFTVAYKSIFLCLFYFSFLDFVTRDHGERKTDEEISNDIMAVFTIVLFDFDYFNGRFLVVERFC